MSIVHRPTGFSSLVSWRKVSTLHKWTPSVLAKQCQRLSWFFVSTHCRSLRRLKWRQCRSQPIVPCAGVPPVRREENTETSERTVAEMIIQFYYFLFESNEKSDKNYTTRTWGSFLLRRAIDITHFDFANAKKSKKSYSIWIRRIRRNYRSCQG